MAIKDALLPEFDHEMATTRALLERVPVDADWKPHAKSMTLGRLSAHVSEIPGWGTTTLTSTELDFNPPGGSPYVSPTYDTTAALVQAFDDNVAAARSAIAAASDADMMVPWTLKNGGQTVLTMPRVAVLRSFVMNHLIHHRAQLGVYLRLKDVPLPSTYGPSADAM
jgi:uncharacterized damage-inducible protein DinB